MVLNMFLPHSTLLHGLIGQKVQYGTQCCTDPEVTSLSEVLVSDSVNPAKRAISHQTTVREGSVFQFGKIYLLDLYNVYNC